MADLTSGQRIKLDEILDFEDRTLKAYSGIPLWQDLQEQVDENSEWVGELIQTLEEVWDGYIECLKKACNGLYDGPVSLIDVAYDEMIKTEKKLYETSCDFMIAECNLRALVVPGYSDGYLECRNLVKELERAKTTGFQTPKDMRDFYKVKIDALDSLGDKFTAEYFKEQTARRRQYVYYAITAIASIIGTILIAWITKWLRI